MKLYKYSLPFVAALFAVGCEDIENQVPSGNGITEAQNTEAVIKDPSLADASFLGMFDMMGYPGYALGDRADDFGYIMMAFSNDIEGADVVLPNSNYNWFSVCGEYSSRTASYANPRIRYATPYNQIYIANDIIRTTAAATDSANVCKRAQAYAVRAFAYEQLAPSFQFLRNLDEPCVPIVTEQTSDFFNNPRATVREIYDLILADLDSAIAYLPGYNRPSNAFVNLQVAYGLRARANLALGKYEAAADDATKAIGDLLPASIEEVSRPSFYSISDKNWIWGIDMTAALAAKYAYATSDSWIRSFSGDSYSAGTACYAMINTLLYDKIPATDVRKGWWVDENLESPVLENEEWSNDGKVTKGQAIATLEIEDVKEAFLPYTNVKFGMASGIGSTTNDSDWPLMRVEEMILIQAEGYAKSGNEAKAKEILGNFVKTYRDPSYDVNAYGNLADEIWKQRRIELWGEGFFVFDANRLQKPIVRFHDDSNNMPDAFRFNLDANDGWRLMRFPQSEMNTNAAIVDNSDGGKPQVNSGSSLRDGVTD